MGNLISLYGLGVDQILSVRLILSTGSNITCSADSHADLFWGLRGAGHNFGIVSSLTVKAYPQVNGGVHWTGTLGFIGTRETLLKITEAIKTMGVGEGMGVTMIWAKPPPDFAVRLSSFLSSPSPYQENHHADTWYFIQPTIILNLWYAGPSSAAEKAYAPLLSLSPLFSQSAPTPYNHLNDANDMISAKGLRKPVYSLGLPSSQLSNLSSVWAHWDDFSSTEGAGQAVVLTEMYGFEKARTVEESSTAFAWRSAGVFVCVPLLIPTK